jgi:hypothetical protein
VQADLDEHHVRRAGDTEIGRVRDEPAGGHLMDNLEPVGRRHVDRLDHRLVDAVRNRLHQGDGLASQQANPNERHVYPR